MSEPSTFSSVVATNLPQLRQPSSLVLLAANMLPLAGVLFWGWDAFVIITLYWLETAVIGFWMLLRVAKAPPESLTTTDENGVTQQHSPGGLTLFFIVHAGMFMGVHFVFLWTLFSGDWAGKIHHLGDFILKLVIATGLWLPLLVLFVARGWAYLYPAVLARLNAWLRPDRVRPGPPRPAAALEEPLGRMIGMFYARIVAMQLAIILGGFLSFAGAIAPLVILIVLKTAVDLGLHVAFDLGNADKAFKAMLRQR